MNLSLYQLKKKLKLNKQAQGGLVAVVLAGLVGSILVSSATSWYLSMRNNIGNVEDKLEAQTIAQSEWERLSHMSLDELEAKRGELAEKYSAGSDSQYQISVNLGQKGTFNNGTCGAIGSDGYANCFKDTTITVYRDGNRMFTTRTLPLMAGDYTRKEIDDKFASLENRMNSKFSDYDKKFADFEARVNKRIDEKFASYDSQFKRLEEKVENSQGYFQGFAQATGSRSYISGYTWHGPVKSCTNYGTNCRITTSEFTFITKSDYD